MSYTKFIILSQERTGSTLLQMLLASDPHVVSFGELFNAEESIRRKVPHEKYYLDEHEDAVSFLRDCVYGEHPEYVEAVGLKLFYGHAYQESWRPLWNYIAQTPVRIIHLKRQNLLARYLSFQLALRSERWIEQEGKHKPTINEPIILNAEECIQDFHKSEWHYRKAAEEFRQHAVLDLTYEALSANIKQEARRVQDFLHLPPRPLSSRMVKQRRKTMRKLIANYDELRNELHRHVREGLARPGWLDFFDDK